MGDISEMRALIVLFTIVSITITLILLIPPDFYVASIDPATAPDASPQDLIAWNSTYTLNITSHTSQDFPLNGYNWEMTSDDTTLQLGTYASWWVFIWDYDDCSWFYGTADLTEIMEFTNLKYLNVTGLTADPPVALVCKNSKTEIKVTLTYNSTAFISYADALDSNELKAVFFVDWNDRNTSMNAFQLIGMVLTASLPDINPILGIVFGFIGWGLIAAASYLVFIFALRIVGAIFGGGGA